MNTTNPNSIGLTEYRFVTSNGLPIECFLAHKHDQADSTTPKLHLMHAVASGIDIMEILGPAVIEQIETQAMATSDAVGEIATFVKLHDASAEFRPARSNFCLVWLA